MKGYISFFMIAGLLVSIQPMASGQDTLVEIDTTNIQLGNYKLIVVQKGDETHVQLFVHNDSTMDTISLIDISRPEKGDVKAEKPQDEESLKELQQKLEEKIKELDEKLDSIEILQDEDEYSMEYPDESYEPEDSHNNPLKLKRKWRRKARIHSNWGGFSFGYASFSDLQNGELVDQLFEGRGSTFRFEFFRASAHLGTPYIALTTGLDISSSTYQLKPNGYLDFNDEEVFLDPNVFTQTTRNQLKVSHIGVPLLLELTTSKHRKRAIVLSAGLYNKFVTEAQTIYHYVENQKKVERIEKASFQIAPYQPELMFRLGFRWLSLWVNLGSNPFFKPNVRPELSSYNLGIGIIAPLVKIDLPKRY